MKDFNKKHWRA